MRPRRGSVPRFEMDRDSQRAAVTGSSALTSATNRSASSRRTNSCTASGSSRSKNRAAITRRSRSVSVPSAHSGAAPSARHRTIEAGPAHRTCNRATAGRRRVVKRRRRTVTPVEQPYRGWLGPHGERWSCAWAAACGAGGPAGGVRMDILGLSRVLVPVDTRGAVGGRRGGSVSPKGEQRPRTTAWRAREKRPRPPLSLRGTGGVRVVERRKAAPGCSRSHVVRL